MGSRATTRPWLEIGDLPAIEAIRVDRELVLVCLLDALDQRSAPLWLAAAQALDLGEARAVRLDLANVKYADTAFVAALVLLSQSLARKLVLGPVSPAVAAVLSLHRLVRPATPAGG